MSGDGIVHGTPGGYRRCLERREGSCEACRAFMAGRQRDRRRGSAEVRARELRDRYARDRALWRLKDMYPDVFRDLVNQEMRKVRVEA